MKILLEGPILSQSGYGEHTRLVFNSLIFSGENFDVHVNPLEWGRTSWVTKLPGDQLDKIKQSISKLSEIIKNPSVKKDFDIHIHVGILNEYTRKAPYSICVTAGIETDRVSPGWIERTYKDAPDKIIFTSEHSRSVFQNSKFAAQDKQGRKIIFFPEQVLSTSGMDVVGYPVKDITPEDIDISLDTKFNFLSICLDGPRKNLHSLVKWFVEEFKDDSDVGLVLKTGKVSGSLLDRSKTLKDLQRTLSNYGDRKCKVYLLHGDLTEEQIHSLYSREDIHVYVTTTCGEGYGLPIFEAAYSGMPIIATDWSGHLDFLSADIKENKKTKNKKLFARLEYELEEVEEHCLWPGVIDKGSRWARVKESSFKKQSRKVYQNYGMYKKWAKTLQESILKNFSKDTIMSDMFRAIITNGYLSGPGQFHASNTKESMIEMWDMEYGN